MAEEKNIIERIIKPNTARGRVWQIFIAILILTMSGLLIDAGKYYNQGVDWVSDKTGGTVGLPHVKEIGYSLGLDLQGGTHLVYEADVSNVPEGKEESSVEGVRDVIERRVNVFGVSEPEVRKVQTSQGEYRIIADLAGIKDVDKAIEMIGRTPLLEFKESGGTTTQLSAGEEEEIENYNQEVEKEAEEVLGKALSGGDFNSLKKEYDESEITDSPWVDEQSEPKIVSQIKDLEPGSVFGDLIKTAEGFEVVELEEERVKTNEFTGETAQEVKANHLLICYQGSQSCENDLSREEALEKIKEIKTEATPDNFTDLVKEHSTEPGAEQTGGDLGWFSREDMVKPFSDTVFDNQEVGTISYVVETKFGFHLIYKQDEREVKEYKINEILLKTKKESEYTEPETDWKNTELTGKYMETANLQWDRTGQPQVSLQFDDKGADLFEKITERNIEEKVAIFLDGELISAPTVNEKISGGQAVISGKFTVQEAKELVKRLNEGALPVPITLISQKTVGPTLGSVSVQDSLKAGIAGLIVVVLFMLAIYRYPGLLAVISLSVYGVLVLAIFKLLSITLTLAGLAGFILSVGMAVDANVLIFERFKEELRKGKDVDTAIKEGFRRAWPSIRDGNISTLITCFILMEFTTTLVRGFAITLGLGILVSLFSAMIVTKNLFLLLPKKWLNKKIIGIK